LAKLLLKEGKNENPTGGEWSNLKVEIFFKWVGENLTTTE